MGREGIASIRRASAVIHGRGTETCPQEIHSLITAKGQDIHRSSTGFCRVIHRIFTAYSHLFTTYPPPIHRVAHINATACPQRYRQTCPHPAHACRPALKSSWKAVVSTHLACMRPGPAQAERSEPCGRSRRPDKKRDTRGCPAPCPANGATPWPGVQRRRATSPWRLRLASLRPIPNPPPKSMPAPA